MRTFKPSLEILESRETPATVAQHGGMLSIKLTSAAQLDVQQDINVLDTFWVIINDGARQEYTHVNNIRIKGSSQADVIDVYLNTKYDGKLTINTGAGADRVEIDGCTVRHTGDNPSTNTETAVTGKTKVTMDSALAQVFLEGNLNFKQEVILRDLTPMGGLHINDNTFMIGMVNFKKLTKSGF